MPKIQGYDDHVQAQGGLAVRADPNDFGAQIGQATQNFGRALGDAAEAAHQYNTTQDVTNVHVNMAKARTEWTKTLQDRANSAQPGDETFAPTMMKDMEAYFQDFGKSVTTPHGKKLFEQMSANMTSEFGIRAIGIQGDLAAKDAVNKYDLLSKSVGATAFQDQTQLTTAIEDGKRAIDDPNGMFAKIPQTARDKFKQQLEQDANYAAANGFVERKGGPAALLQSIAPDILKQFEPTQKLIDANTAPGAKAKVSSSAMQWAPQVQRAASAKGLNPNILLAQIDAESGGNPNAVGPMTKYGTAKGLTQFIDSTAKDYGVDVKNPQSAIAGQAAYMSDLLTKYGGDYRKALAAYNWGPGNLDSSLSRWGNDWANHLPTETSNYVAKIMMNAGAVAPMNSNSMAVASLAPTPLGGIGAPAPGAEPAPARQPITSSSLPFINGLSWEQQNTLVNKAIQLQNMEWSNIHRAREEQEYQLKKQREQVAGQFINRIIDPERNGGAPSDAEITANQVLTWQEKQHMADYKLRRQVELRTGIENKPNPVEVRRLMLQIHAADDNPTKTYSFEPVMEAYRNGSINTSEMKMLRTEVEQMKDGNGSSFMKQMQMAREKAYGTFARSFEASLPGGSAMANDAYYRFTTDLNARVEALRKENKDPSVLLDPKSREYMLSPERMQSYWPNASTILAQQAGKTAQQAAQDRTPAAGYEVGKEYTVNGKKMTYQGGALNISTSWK